MRISDWSSDVCSSDLLRYVVGVEANPVKSLRRDKIGPVVVIAGPHEQKRTGDIEDSATPSFPSANAGYKASDARSEEHTSELQSLMRISYAVFCLKKKNIYLQAQ